MEIILFYINLFLLYIVSVNSIILVVQLGSMDFHPYISPRKILTQNPNSSLSIVALFPATFDSAHNYLQNSASFKKGRFVFHVQFL